MLFRLQAFVAPYTAPEISKLFPSTKIWSWNSQETCRKICVHGCALTPLISSLPTCVYLVKKRFSSLGEKRVSGVAPKKVMPVSWPDRQRAECISKGANEGENGFLPSVIFRWNSFPESLVLFTFRQIFLVVWLLIKNIFFQWPSIFIHISSCTCSPQNVSLLQNLRGRI